MFQPIEIRRLLTDPDNPVCPLFRFMGNPEAKKIMQRAAFAAWGRPNHSCADLSFAMVGPASAGKTTLARLFGETVQLPFIEIPPRGIRNSKEFFDHIAVTLERTVVEIQDGLMSLKMVKPDPWIQSDPTMLIPPCIVFIDEVHGLPTNLRETLLQAIESKDRMLNIDGGWYANCKDVCWIVATTERGKLFGPFDSRFTKVELDMYGTEEIAMIVYIDNHKWFEQGGMPLGGEVLQPPPPRGIGLCQGNETGIRPEWRRLAVRCSPGCQKPQNRPLRIVPQTVECTGGAGTNRGGVQESFGGLRRVRYRGIGEVRHARLAGRHGGRSGYGRGDE